MTAARWLGLALALSPSIATAQTESDGREPSRVEQLGLSLSPEDAASTERRLASFDHVRRRMSQVIGVLRLPTLAPATEYDADGRALSDRGGLEIAFEIPRAGPIVRALDNVSLRAQCPLVESWSAIDVTKDVRVAVACRVVFGESITSVSTRAAHVLARRGRAVSAAAIARDLSGIPADARLSQAMIVPHSRLQPGQSWQSPMDPELEVSAPQPARHPAACRSFRSRWPVSYSVRDQIDQISSAYPDWDRGSALAQCWGPRGEWAIGVTDRSYVNGMSMLAHRVWARIAFIAADGRVTRVREGDSCNEDYGIRTAIDLDDDGSTELVLDWRCGLNRALTIYTVRAGRIVPWDGAPPRVRGIADLDGDHRPELLSQYAPPSVVDSVSIYDLVGSPGDRDRFADIEVDTWQRPFTELFERVDGGYSNRTPLAVQYAARQCPAIPQPMVPPNATSRQVLANVRCARLRGVSPEETIFRLCSSPQRPCAERRLRDLAEDIARDDVPFFLR